MNKKKGILGIVVLIMLLGIALILGIRRDNKLKNENKEDYNNWQQENSNNETPKEQVEEPKVLKVDFYTKLKNKEEVKVVIIGDRIALSEGKTSAGGIWSEGVAYIINKDFGTKATVDLLAKQELTVTTALQLVSGKNLKQYDLAILCLGHNDNEINLNTSDFKEQYIQLLSEIKSKGDGITTMLLLPSTLKKDNIYRKIMEQSARRNLINIIDTRETFEKNGVVQKELINGELPNDLGYQYYTTTFAKVLHDNIK